MSLHIYKSSAGSGKTYTLAREYLRLALRSPDYYKGILAVTFTNRAAEEMKERVLEFLIDISKGKHELTNYFADELNVTEKSIQKKATATLQQLLHHYGYFSITTIDTFFHRVIRAFSREIGLQGGFGIELDTEKVAEIIAADVYEGSETDRQLKNWLVEFSMQKLLDGKGYEPKNDIQGLAKQLFSEEYKAIADKLPGDEEGKQLLKSLQQALYATKNAYESHLAQIGDEFYQKVEHTDVGLEEFAGGKKRTIPNFFKKLSEKRLDDLINSTIKKCSADPSKWATKTSAKRSLIIHHAAQDFMPLMHEAIDYIEQNQARYRTAEVVLRHLFTYGLMADLTERLRAYKQEEDIIMISDLPDFLSQIIDDSGSPFIYEKVGNRYQHYLIDEFQDTSQLQWNNFRPLLEESLSHGHENIIVGDAKQSIYGWRGGEPALLMFGVQQDIPQADTDESKLTNWRSAPEVVRFNNDLFDKLPKILSGLMEDVLDEDGQKAIIQAYEGVEQQIAARNTDEKGYINISFLPRSEVSFEEVALEKLTDQLEHLIEEGHSMNDMAILVRTNREAATIVNHVLDYRRNNDTKLQVISAEGMLLNNAPIVQLLLSAFRHLIDPDDGAIRADLIFRYHQLVQKHHFDQHSEFLKLTEGSLPQTFTKYKEHFLHLPIYELTEVLIRCFDLAEVKEEFAYLQAFQDAVLEFSKNHRSDLRLFLDWWKENGYNRSVQLTGSLDAVEIITSHKSKGLQYPVVLVPFCNFHMDSRPHTGWYPTPDDKPFNQVDVVPLEYASSLDNTVFQPSYRQQMAKWHLESLNILYVAFTRAERGLIAFCEAPPKTQSKMYSSVSKLLYTYFQTQQPEGWSEKEMAFEVGELAVKPPKQNNELMALGQFHSHKWSDKLTVRKTGKAYYNDDAVKQRDEGILLHQILSEIIHHDEAEEVLDKYLARMEITEDDKKNYLRLFHNIWQNDVVKDWFAGGYTVKTEVLVLPKDGESKRMDRVMIRDGQAKVVDFKSGQPKKGDQDQVKEYLDILKQMGYEPTGYLLYLKDGSLYEV